MRSSPIWQWQASDGSWASFDCTDSLALELKYCRYRNCSFRSCHRSFCTLGRKRQPYLVRFKALTARNLVSLKASLLRRVVKTNFDGDAGSSFDFGRGGDDFCGQKAMSIDGDLTASCMSLASTFLSSDSLRINEAQYSLGVDFGRCGDDFCEVILLDDQTEVMTELDSDISIKELDACTIVENSPFDHIVSGFCHRVDIERMTVQVLSQHIDKMWLEEVTLETCAELHAVVIEASESIENGADIFPTINAALTRVQVMREWLSECLTARAANRQTVSLEGGYEFAERYVSERFSEIYQRVASLLQKLTCVEDVGTVKVYAHKLLTNSVNELESISDLKEANTHTVLSICEKLDETEEIECNFALAVVQAAAANPESYALHKQAFETLLRIFDAHSMELRSDRHIKAHIPQFLRFVSEAMHKGHECLHGTGSRVLRLLVRQRIQSDTLECQFIPSLLHAMEVHKMDPCVQVRACQALLDISCRDTWGKVMMEWFAVADIVLEAMSNHPDEYHLHRLGNELISSLVVGRILQKVLRINEVASRPSSYSLDL